MAGWNRPLTTRRLSLLSLNVNGLSAPAKRTALFSRLTELPHDVIVLQETHCEGDGSANAWLRVGAGAGRPWGGTAFWSHGQRASRGVAILFRAGFSGSDVRVEFSDSSSNALPAPSYGAGRVLRVGWQDLPTGQRWSVVALYAPNSESARQSFFSTEGPVWKALSAGPADSHVVLAGDFNCVLDAEDSSASSAAAQAAAPGSNALRDLSVHFRLSDAWQHYRSRHSATDSPYTYWATSCSTARRLDRIYTSSDVLARGQLLVCRHLPLGDLPGDHSPVEMQLSVEGLASASPPRWRLPLDLLYDAAFVDDIRKELACVAQRKGRNWESMTGASAMHAWLKFKQRVRDLARGHMARRAHALACERRTISAGVQTAAADFARSVTAAAQAAVPTSGPQPVAAAAQRVREEARKLRAFDQTRAGTEAAKADAAWHHYGEKPTFWFHRLGEQHAPTPPMTSVKDPSTGQTVVATNRAEAQTGAELVADFFDGDRPTGLFAPAQTDPQACTHMLNGIDKRLSAEDSHACEGPTADGSLTAEELHRSLKTMQRGKSPGMDGLPYEFYVTFWAELSSPFTAAVNEEFLGHSASPCYEWRFTVGIISLLFKGTVQKPLPADQVASYRPITLLNSDYKLVAKAIALRVAAALDKVIDETQTAFVPGRWIGDNVLYHMGLIDALSPDLPGAGAASASAGTAPALGPAPPPVVGPAPGGTAGQFEPAARPLVPRPPEASSTPSACVLFLDFEKAYDKVAREWILACYETLGFGPRVLRWLRLLLEGTKAVVSFGGCFSRMFSVRSGAAQGSPLSPLLYVAAAQPLAAALRRLQQDGDIDAVSLPGGVTAPPSHQHADDTSIHTATVQGAQKAIELAVQPFCRASGSSLNLGKSEGLTLGGHAPLEGLHQPSGVQFVGAHGMVKHLGVMLTKGDRSAAATAMWQKRVTSVAVQVRHWGNVDLTLLGRVYVARQVMANTITYHAQFVEPPAPQLKSLQRLIDGFVLGKPVDPETDDRPVRGRPSATVWALPLKEGGLGAADIELQATALRAKAAAKLLHPQRRPWKLLANAAFEAAYPGVGTAAMLTVMAPGGSAARNLSRRLSSYWAALRRTHPHRLVPPSDMLAQQVDCEPLAGNLRVAPAPGAQSGLGWVAAQRQWGPARRLRDLRTAAATSPLPADVPIPWASKLTQPAPPTAWAVSGDGAWVRYSRPGSERGFRVASDGRLLDPPLGTRLPGPPILWQDCCVVACPPLRGRPPGAKEPLPPLRPWLPDRSAQPQRSQDERPPPVDLYLVDAWTTTSVDPSLWGHAEQPLTHYTVKEATLRMKRLRAVKELGGRYSPLEAVAPSLWGPGARDRPDHAAIESVARRYTSTFRSKLQLHSTAQARPPVSDAELAAIFRQPWMHPSPPRQLPLERAAQRQAHDAQAASNAHGVTRDDNLDALCKWGEGRPEWRKAWKRAQQRGRPRPHRVFEWQLLHAALPVGATKVVFVPAGAPNLAEVVCCNHPACRPSPSPGSLPAGSWQLETLQHALLECPAVKPALQWLVELWIRIDGGSGPPLTPAVWLQGAADAWRPQREIHTALWRTLRVSMLAAAWALRTRRAAGGREFQPDRVVKGFVADIRRIIHAEWQVVTSRCTQMVGTHRSWFPGRQPIMDVAEFEMRWCGGGVLAHVVQGPGAGDPTLEYRLDDVAWEFCRRAGTGVDGGGPGGGGGADGGDGPGGGGGAGSGGGV